MLFLSDQPPIDAVSPPQKSKNATLFTRTMLLKSKSVPPSKIEGMLSHLDAFNACQFGGHPLFVFLPFLRPTAAG